MLVLLVKDIDSLFSLSFFREYKDGETVFYHRNESITITPQAGTCVLFTHDVQHEGKKVTDGKKFILR